MNMGSRLFSILAKIIDIIKTPPERKTPRINRRIFIEFGFFLTFLKSLEDSKYSIIGTELLMQTPVLILFPQVHSKK